MKKPSTPYIIITLLGIGILVAICMWVESPKYQQTQAEHRMAVQKAVQQYMFAEGVEAKNFPWNRDGRVSFDILRRYQVDGTITQEQYDALMEPMVIWKRNKQPSYDR